MKHLMTFRTSFFLFTTLLYSGADAQSANQPDELNAVYACKTEINPTDRLKCYDNAVGRFEAAQNSGDVVTVSKAQVENVEREAFGYNIPSLPSLGSLFGAGNEKKTTPQEKPLTTPTIAPKSAEAPTPQVTASPPPIVKPRPKPSDVQSVTLDILKTSTFGYKKTRFFFSNGQVWEQTDGTQIRIPKVRNGVPNNAKISKASLGSFFLRLNGKGTALRVRRVR